jgi:hypothetical protein
LASANVRLCWLLHRKKEPDLMLSPMLLNTAL